MAPNTLHQHGLAAISRDEELEATVQELAADTGLWTRLVAFAEPRLRIPLPSPSGIEAKLLTWAPGQGCGLHDHGGSAGCFMVLRETVWETVVDYDGDIHELIHHAGDIGSFERDIIHDVRNEGTRGAVTLHAYRPALTRMTQYVIEDGAVKALRTNIAGIDY
jgi:hypothetical protein